MSARSHYCRDKHYDILSIVKHSMLNQKITMLFLVAELILPILFTAESNFEEMLNTSQQEHILNKYCLSYGTHNVK